MKRIIKITLINLVIFFSFFVLIEIFFYFALQFHFLEPRHNIAQHFNSLMPKKVIELHGNSAFDIPEKYQADKQYDWSLAQTRDSRAPLTTYYDPTYFDDYNKHKNISRSYKSYKALAEAPFTKIFEHEYTFDSDGLRKVFTSFRSLDKAEFVLTFGDSFTFGEGVQNGYEYPSLLAEKLGPSYQVHNYGFHGMSLNDFYYKSISEPEQFNKNFGPQGTIIWLFIPEHLERFFCHLQCHLNTYEWISVKPQIKLVDGLPTVIGRIKENLSLQSLFLNLLSKSNLIRYLNFEYPADYSEEEYRTFALTMADLFKNKVQPQSQKRIVFVNLMPFPQKDQLFKELSRVGIEVTDFSNIPYPSLIKKGNIPLEGHPTSEFYWVISSLIKSDVFKKK